MQDHDSPKSNMRERLKQGLVAQHMRAEQERNQINQTGLMNSSDFWNSHQCRKITYDIFHGTFIPGSEFNIDTALQDIQLNGFYHLFQEIPSRNKELTSRALKKKETLQACWRFLFLNTCFALRGEKKAISLSLDKNNYSKTGRYYCPFWSYTELQEVTKRSISAGYFKKHRGIQKKDGQRSYISRFEILEEFKNLIKSYIDQNRQSSGGNLPNDCTYHDIVLNTILPLPDKPLLVIKHEDDKITEPSRNNRNIQQMYNRVEKYNEFMAKQQLLIGVDLDNTKESHLKILTDAINRDKLKIVNPEEIFKTNNRSGEIQLLKEIHRSNTRLQELKKKKNPLINYSLFKNKLNINNLSQTQTNINNKHQLYPFNNSILVNDINEIQVPSDGLLYLLQSRYRCYRSFNNSMKNGGRFYGIVNQSLPSEIRLNTLINGHPVVELDFKALHPSLLYSMVGIQPPKDIYIYEDPEDMIARKLMKITALVLFNAPDERSALSAIRLEYSKRYGVMLKNDEFLRPCIDLFFEENPELRKFYLKGKSGMLQNMDSMIMDQLLSSLIKLEIPAIPIHDSIIVPDKDLNQARTLMILAYQIVTKTSHIPYITIESNKGDTES